MLVACELELAGGCADHLLFTKLQVTIPRLLPKSKLNQKNQSLGTSSGLKIRNKAKKKERKNTTIFACFTLIAATPFVMHCEVVEF